MARHTVARIDIGALRHNLRVARGLAGDSRIVAVIKADAYGHGIERVAQALDEADVFAVATPGEIEAVRASGWKGRLLLLEGFANAEAFDLAGSLGAELVLHQREQLDLVEQRGLRSGQRIWLKLDSGMNRLGFPLECLDELMGRVKAASVGAPPVLMTHFACADDPADGMTDRQVAAFDAVVDSYGLEHSLANSAAIVNFPATCRDYVRPGILLYGSTPGPKTAIDALGLRPAMTLECEIIAINACRAGDRVGYGATFTCPEDMRVGVAAIGYGDGYPRRLPNGAPVLVNDRRATLAGRISMDLTTIDLRGHDDARVGDRVTLWGQGLPVEEVASWADAIAYELVCGVTGRVPREYR